MIYSPPVTQQTTLFWWQLAQLFKWESGIWDLRLSGTILQVSYVKRSLGNRFTVIFSAKLICEPPMMRVLEGDLLLLWRHDISTDDAWDSVLKYSACYSRPRDIMFAYAYAASNALRLTFTTELTDLGMLKTWLSASCRWVVSSLWFEHVVAPRDQKCR